MSELSDAVAFVRSMDGRESIAFGEDCDRFLAAQGQLVDAYLAEHPADSSEPVTWEWLDGLGFQMPGGDFQIATANGAYLCFEKDGEFVLRFDTADRVDYVPLGYEYRTRGDVRLLLKALHIKAE